LHRGNGTLLGRSNTLLEGTHVGGESRLVTYGRGNTTQKGRYLRTSLGETENVVDEEQHILARLVTEVFGDGKTSQGYSRTSTGGFVHLSVHEGGLGASTDVFSGLQILRVLQFDYARGDHFVIQIISFSCTLTDTSEHRETTVGLGNVVDKFHNQYSLAYTSTTEQADLSSLAIRSEKIYDLNTGDQDLIGGTLINESRGRGVNGVLLLCANGALVVDGLANYVDDTAKSLGADRHHDRVTQVNYFLSTLKTIGGIHGNATAHTTSEVLGNLKNKFALCTNNFKGVQNRRELVLRELDVNYGTNDLSNMS